MLRARDIAIMVAHPRRVPRTAGVVNKDALPMTRRSAPTAAAARIIARKPLIHQDIAKTLATARQYTQFAAIAVFVAVNRLQRKWACVDELAHPYGRLCTQFCLSRATRLMRFRGVDIRDADFAALILDGVPIDDAVGSSATVAKPESGGLLIDRACCNGILTSRSGWT